MTEPFHIRTMSVADLALAVDWAATEGWNPGLDDVAPFHAADPDGYFMGFRGGTPVAAISVVNYGDRFAFLGFYIVAPGHRGEGHGLATWRAALAHAGDRTVGLDGVVDQQANYARSGFVLAGRNIRYAGRPEATGPRSPAVVPVAGEIVEAVVAYDRPFFAGPRERFLRPWLAPPRTALAYLRDGAVAGYGVVRRCRSGVKIGPLFADDEAVADALFAALAAVHPGEEVVVDPPEQNAAATALAARHGLAPVFETARMYRGQAPVLPIGRTYGITTFELG